MSSEHLASAENHLKGNLGGAWDVIDGASGQYQDLGLARRFGGASAAYSLRDIGAMNGSVVRVRRSPEDTTDAIDDEERFSANQVQDGTLEKWVNGELETTLPGDIATARSLHSLRKIRSGYTGDALRIRRIDNTEVNVAFDSSDKVSTSSSITNISSGDVDDTAETTLGNFLQGEADVRALFNSSAYFPSDSDYFSLGSGLTLSGAFTISYDVVFTDSFTTNTSRIFQDDAGNDLLTFTASDVCKFRVNGTVRTMPALSTTLQLGRKYSMIFARDGSGNYTLTIDGVQVSSVSGTDTDDFLIQRIGFRNRGSISNININSGQHIYVGDGAENSNWTDTGSGTTTNATKVGTPVAFTGQGIDSFVHTWYNQSGASTGATQTTAQRQPKIASNGTLLDHILFDGSNTVTTPASTDPFLVDTSINFNDALTLGCVSDRLATTNFGMYPVSVSRQSATNRFFGIQEATSQSVFITRNSTSVNHSVDNTSTLKRFTMGRVGSGSETDAEISIFGRAFGNNNGADWGNVVGVSNQDSFVIGALGFANDTGSVATNTATFQGKVYETFAYQTDEKDELFKIASNVNNYYGLYNDANSFSANAQVDGTGSTVSNASKDGGTLTLSSASGNNYLYFQLTETVPATSGDIFISFNYESSDDSVTLNNVKLRDDADNAKSGDLVYNSSGTAITIQKNGFYSGKLASANLTDTGTRLAFLTNQTTNGYTFTISNLRYSRIARSGFVQTWYDQSGNNRPMIQTNASEQPSIVENGGFIGGVKADAATSNDTMQNLQVSTDGTTANFGTNSWANGGTKLGLIYVGKILTGTTATNPAPFWGAGRGVSQFQTGAVSFQVIKGGNDSFRLVNERQDLSPSSMTTSLTFNSDDDIIVTGTTDNRDFTLTVNASSQSETEAADLDVRETTPISLFGSYDKNAGRYYQRSSAGVCKECYLFSGDNITEVDTISTEINKHYNIY